MTAFEQLRQRIVEAEQRSKRKNLQANYEKAQQVYEAARGDYEKVQENLKQARLRHGNFEQNYEQRMRELTAMRETSLRLKEELAEEARLDELFNQAKKEIEELFQSARKEISVLEEKQKGAQDILRKAFEAYKVIKLDYDAVNGVKTVTDGSAAESTAAVPGVVVPATPADLDSLRESINSASTLFGEWPPEEQHAMLSVWAGKARALQEMGHWSESEEGIIKGIFGRLNFLSGTHRPGFVNALSRTYVTNWTEYTSENNEKYVGLVKSRKLREQADQERRVREQEQRKSVEAARSRLAPDLERLRELAAMSPESAKYPEMLEIVLRLLQALNGRLEDEEIEILLPHREAFKENSDFRWLRKQFDRLERAQDPAELGKMFPQAFENARGKKVVMIGGSPREDVRRDLMDFFKMAELTWESCQGNEPQVISQVEQRVRNKGVDVLIELTSFVGHHVETLRPVCEQNNCIFARVAKGYGRAQIAQAMQGTGYRSKTPDR